MARYIAKNLVASELCEKCEVQISYAIGVKEPTSILVDTFNTGKLSEKQFDKLVRNVFDLTPQGIIKTLDLKKPIYSKTSVYGHFGRDFSWEKTDKAQILKEKAKDL